MKIRYKKRKLRINLIFGLFWLVFAIIQLFIFDYESKSWIKYGWLGISLMYIIMYFYEYFNQYLTIENGIIKMNSLFGKKMNLTEIKQIKKFAGDYILKTDKAELTINTQIIEPNSLAELNTELEKVNVEWT